MRGRARARFCHGPCHGSVTGAAYDAIGVDGHPPTRGRARGGHTTKGREIMQQTAEKSVGPGASAEVSFTWPMPAGKEEWRRFLQQLEGSRLEECERAKERLGVEKARVWLQRDRGGVSAVTYAVAEDPAGAVAALAASEEPFEVWFKGKIEDLLGIEVGRLRPGAAPEMVLRSGA